MTTDITAPLRALLAGGRVVRVHDAAAELRIGYDAAAARLDHLVRIGQAVKGKPFGNGMTWYCATQSDMDRALANRNEADDAPLRYAAPALVRKLAVPATAETICAALGKDHTPQSVRDALRKAAIRGEIFVAVRRTRGDDGSQDSRFYCGTKQLASEWQFAFDADRDDAKARRKAALAALRVPVAAPSTPRPKPPAAATGYDYRYQVDPRGWAPPPDGFAAAGIGRYLEG